MKQGKQKKAIVLFSGGLDSTTCLFWAVKKWGKDAILALSFKYGQKHEFAETEFALGVCRREKIDHKVLSVGTFTELANSALTVHTRDINAKDVTGRFPASFVPGRNAIFLTFAASLAYGIGAMNLVTGVNAVDYSGYPDCRPVFITNFGSALSYAMDKPILIHTPIIYKTKVEIFELAGELGILELAKQSRSCYNGVLGGCGNCDSCRIRDAAWKEYKAKMGEV